MFHRIEIHAENGFSAVEREFLTFPRRNKLIISDDTEMSALDKAAIHIKRSEHLPEVGKFRLLLHHVILRAHLPEAELKEIAVGERNVDKRFDGTESGKQNDPVVKDTVFDSLAIEPHHNLLRTRLIHVPVSVLESRSEA